MGKMFYQDNASLEEKKAFVKYLAEDEELVLVTGFGKMYLRHQYIFYVLFPGAIFILLGLGIAYVTGFNLGVGLVLGLLVALLVAFLKVWVLNMANKYLLTTRRVIVKRGFLAVRIASALYDKITHIEVDQGFMDRMFLNHGTIIINTAGTSKDELILRFVEAPIQFKNLLERLINREREQFGRGTGPVVSLEGEVVD